jgi:hypothetical protein
VKMPTVYNSQCDHNMPLEQPNSGIAHGSADHSESRSSPVDNSYRSRDSMAGRYGHAAARRAAQIDG